jgi:hypothetical protein
VGVPEGGLSTSEVGKQIAEHAERTKGTHDRHGWVIAVIEASLLALVALVAAWSGFSSAKWGTESRLKLAQAATARTEAATDQVAALTYRNFDSSTFTAWFVAYVAGDPVKMAVAERRFTPNFRAAFDAWMATDPETNPNAPQGPTYMPQYKQPYAVLGTALNNKADRLYSEGSTDGAHSDAYVRVTVYLALVLFLLGISGHFAIRGVRIGLICVAVLALAFSLGQLAVLPLPPV